MSSDNYSLPPEIEELEEIDIQIEPVQHVRHRLELRSVGMVQSVREGPFISHNVMITHFEFLNKANTEQNIKLWRTFPLGGSFNHLGDSIALAVWMIVLAYDLSAIPMACLCNNMTINIINSSILSILFVYFVSCAYLITKNCKKMRRHWFIAETNADKYQGLQNYFIDVDDSRSDKLYLINQTKRREIIKLLNTRQGNSLFLMLCTKQYWKNRIVLPIISLSTTSVLAFIGIIINLETMRQSHFL